MEWEKHEEKQKEEEKGENILLKIACSIHMKSEEYPKLKTTKTVGFIK